MIELLMTPLLIFALAQQAQAKSFDHLEIVYHFAQKRVDHVIERESKKMTITNDGSKKTRELSEADLHWLDQKLERFEPLAEKAESCPESYVEFVRTGKSSFVVCREPRSPHRADIDAFISTLALK